MALRTIREIGDPILEKECKPLKAVSDRTIDLINDMFETMYAANGVGLAASFASCSSSTSVMASAISASIRR